MKRKVNVRMWDYTSDSPTSAIGIEITQHI